MSSYDYEPLERVALPGLGDLACAGLILVVGPNSSGKSQFLQDIYQRIGGEPRKLVVATAVDIRKTDYEPFMGYLESEGYFETYEDENGNAQWRPLRTYVGVGAVNPIQRHQAQAWHSAHSQVPATNWRRRSEFLNYFGRLLVCW